MEQFTFNREYNKEQGVYFINNQTYTNHCHRFMAIALRTALDAQKIVDGPKIFETSVEDSMRKVLKESIKNQKVDTLRKKIELVQSYYTWAGLGIISFDAVGENGGEVTLTSSHADEAWKLMIGQATEPINFITKGFIAAAFGVFYDKLERSYHVEEVESIILGHEKSTFKINLK